MTTEYKMMTFGDYVTLIASVCFISIPLLVGVSFEMWMYEMHHLLAVLNDSVVIWVGVIFVGVSNTVEMLKRMKAHRSA